MSSWLPSFFNLTDDADADTDDDNPSSPRSPSAGVKEDLSNLFRGVAAFLAPPTNSTETPSSGTSADTIAGIKYDLAEIQGTFKSGFSLFSSKLTSNLLSFPRQINGNDDDEDFEGEEEDDDEIVGITEEVVDFVRRISLRPELWTDFPISLPDDIEMSDYQTEHAAEIEHLVPSLVILRQKVSSQISSGKFWIIYFILLFPRLNEEDLKFLATPKVVETREMLLQQLQSKIGAPQETSEISETVDTSEDGSRGEERTAQHKYASDETINATIETNVVKNADSDHESEVADPCSSVDTQKQSEDEDDISFSDLEDEDNDLSRVKLSQSNKRVSSSEGKEWVELNKNSGAQDGQQKAGTSVIRYKGSESEESNEWLTVDDTDIES